MTLARTGAGSLAFASATSVSLGSVIAVPADRLILVVVWFHGTNEAAAITPSTTHGSLTLLRRDTLADATFTQAVYYQLNTVSQTYTWGASIASGAAGPCGIAEFEWSGEGTSPVLVAVGATGSGFTSAGPSFSAAADGVFMFHGISGSATGSPTVPALTSAAEITGRIGGVNNFDSWQAINNFAGTVPTQSSTWNVSSQWIAQGVAIQIASAAVHYTASLAETVSSPLAESVSATLTVGPGHVLLVPPAAARVPLGDVRVVWLDGALDAMIVGDDVGVDQGLVTAVILSLFTDRRAEDDDVLPSDDGDKRGWWGDEFSVVEGDRTGSRLWLLDRSARRPDVPQRAEEYCREALAWMLEDRVASVIDAHVEAVGAELVYTISLTRPSGGDPVSFRFKHAWDTSPSGRR